MWKSPPPPKKRFFKNSSKIFVIRVKPNIDVRILFLREQNYVFTSLRIKIAFLRIKIQGQTLNFKIT